MKKEDEEKMVKKKMEVVHASMVGEWHRRELVDGGGGSVNIIGHQE